MAKNKATNHRESRKLICSYSVSGEVTPNYIIVAEDEAGDNHVSGSESFTRALADVLAEMAEYDVEVQSIKIYRKIGV